jgi:hypothetical protein
MPSVYRLFLILSLALVGPLLCAERSAARSQPLVEVTGNAIGYDASQGLLQVNTRLGTKRYFVTNTTLVLLNNHSSTPQNIQAGDKLVISYDYATVTAKTIRIVRKGRTSGTVVSVSTTAIGVRSANGAVLALRPDAASRILLEGVPLTSNQVLLGRRVTATYEPTSLLVLSLSGTARVSRGTLSEVDADAGLITLNGSLDTLTVDENATIYRNGISVELADLTAGDRVRVIQVRDGDSVRALAIEARPGTVASGGRGN